MGAWKLDNAQLGNARWSVSIPPASHFLLQQAPLKKSRGGALTISEVSVSPQDRYSFMVLKRNGDTVATFHFDSFEDCFAAARDMKNLLPHIARVLARP